MLNEPQLAALTLLFHRGSNEASLALSRWVDRRARVSVDRVEQVALADAAGELGDPEQPICCCLMSLAGGVTGQLLMTFDNAHGLALADIIQGLPAGTSKEWGEMERSAVLETANILGCAYLNALARSFATTDAAADVLLPSPPRFARDFAASLLSFALLDQAAASDLVFLTHTEFHIEDSPLTCELLLIPDRHCLAALRHVFDH
ncbi:MAG TPA: hypothetical protein VF278_19405 [Pirellulales bacterium]